MLGTSGNVEVIFLMVDLDELKAAVCKSLWRYLTANERITYGITDTGPACP